jgi:hypothetical protein
MNAVMVLHAALPGDMAPVRAGLLLQRLPYAHRLELERRDAAARSASLLGLQLVLDGAARLRGTPHDVSRLRFPADGKPYCEGGPWFSVSHSRTRVAVALSDCCDLGIDVEDRGKGPADGDVRERWTAIEATLKAAGSGLRRARDVQLAADLATARIDDRTVYTRSVALAPDCVARIASWQPVQRVVVEERGLGKGMGDRG